MSQMCDAITVGSGQPGPSLTARMTWERVETAIVGRKLFGGAFVNVGCIPTEALVASAPATCMARRGADFGVNVVAACGGTHP